MIDIISLILAIPIFFLLIKLYFIPVLKVYNSLPVVEKLNDEELAYDFKIRHGILYSLMDLWIATAIYIANIILTHQEEIAQMNIEFNVNENTIGKIIILFLGVIPILIIPILFIIYLIKHHFALKKYEFKKHSRIGVELTQFIVGITSFWSFPFGIGVKLAAIILDVLISGSGKSKTKISYSYFRDSKGESRLITTITDTETGYGESYWKDDKGETHTTYHYR